MGDMSGGDPDPLAGLDEELVEGARVYNAGSYLEAHEVFENLWMVEVGPRRIFTRGLVHISMGFHYACRLDLPSAISKLTSALELLEGFDRDFLGVDVEALRAGGRACLERVRAIAEGRAAGFDPGLIPRIRTAKSRAASPSDEAGSSPQARRSPGAAGANG